MPTNKLGEFFESVVWANKVKSWFLVPFVDPNTLFIESGCFSSYPRSKMP
jgi:hypothetical protein